MDLLSVNVIFVLVILVFSAILHEVAHGWIADRLGDPTARLRGRLTLNPIPHIDPIFTILMPLLVFFASQGSFIFGGAKPVPVDPFNLRDGRKDMSIVALAGPGTNLLIALLIAGFIHILSSVGMTSFEIYQILRTVVGINLLLAIFNLLPIPPLDGSKVFSLFLTDRQAASYLSIGSMGIFILFFLLLFPIGGFSLGSIVFNLLEFSMRLLGL
ncbi:MAG: Membrane endopeptidase, M50 family [Candidatus Levybacteria bacterium GW2011_GWA2_40_8]|nr:MAG: Membrane endopeptidase, M50 family [Candidatus Levybacteria bacterium GW2011_GWA2_40_8]